MSVYNDMANDAGYRYGSVENEQLAQQVEYGEMIKAHTAAEEAKAYSEYCEFIGEQL